jgi:type IV pilus assembly protein PilM
MPFSIGKLLGSFTSGKGSVIGVDIGSSSVKIVQLSRKGGKVILDTYGALALGPYSGIEVGRATMLPPEKIGDVLKDLFREATATSRNSGIAIPLASSLVTMIEMPALPDKELGQMIPIEARKYIPVPISEVMLDWWVIPKNDEKTTSYMSGAESGATKGKMLDVLLVVILNDSLTKQQTIVKSSGLVAGFYEIEIFSTIRSVLDGGMQPVMVVDFGAASTKLYVIERGVVRVSHTVSKGSQDITLVLANALGISIAEAENMKRVNGLLGEYNGQKFKNIADIVLKFIFSEANTVLLNYEKKFGRNVGKAVLTGGGSTLKGVLEVAKSVFETDVVLGDPFSKVQTPAFMDPVLKQVGPEFAVAVGLALRRLFEQESA